MADMITSERLTLRPWRDDDLEVFVALHADPEVMVDSPPIERARSEAKFDRYREAFDSLGFCRWALTRHDGLFLGYVGIMRLPDDHPLGSSVEIGWRLTRAAWGHGYATEGARAALEDAFRRPGVSEVVSFTAPDNLRSQAVMERLGLERAADRDFVMATPEGPWTGWVWIARPRT